MVDKARIDETFDRIDKLQERMDELQSEMDALEELKETLDRYLSGEIYDRGNELEWLRYEKGNLFVNLLEAYYEKGELCQKDITSQEAKEKQKA